MGCTVTLVYDSHLHHRFKVSEVATSGSLCLQNMPLLVHYELDFNPWSLVTRHFAFTLQVHSMQDIAQ